MPSTPSRLAASKKAIALALDMGRVAHPRMLLEHAPEQPLAVLERDVQQRPTVVVQQVERLVDEAAWPPCRRAWSGAG